MDPIARSSVTHCVKGYLAVDSGRYQNGYDVKVDAKGVSISPGGRQKSGEQGTIFIESP